MITSGRDATTRASSAVALPTILGIALIVFVVVFWRLGAPSFWDPDEAHYAETTRELLETGDRGAPYYNEQPFFDKPILFHWLQGIPMAMVGPTELGARLAPALAALALIGVTAWVGIVLLSVDTAVIAALLLATSPAMFALARYAILETVFTVFLFGGAALVSIAGLYDRPRLQWYGYVALALAVLTKGPLALVLCGLTFALTALVSTDEARARLFGLRIVTGFAIVLVISGPWFVYMGLRFGDAFVNGYLLDENIRLYASDRFTPTASSSVWFYFRVLGAGLLPWTLLIVGRLYDDVRAWLRRDGSLDQADVLLWSWTIAIVAFFTFSKFKLDHYVFPVAPALCLICGRAWVDVRAHPADPRHTGARVGRLFIGPLLMVVAAAGGYLLSARLELPRAAFVVPGIVGLAGIVTVMGVNLQGRRPPAIPWMVFAALTVTYAGVVLWVFPALEQQKVVPDVARWVMARATSSDRIATYRLNRWNNAFRFYVARHVAMIDAPEEATSLFNGAEPFYCTMLGSAYDELVAQGAPLRIVYEREGLWATSGRALWRRRAPLTRFVVVTRSQ
jgi:4-amino-4-deoxy-L-arabinose transferase-like glycosyltransferase